MTRRFDRPPRRQAPHAVARALAHYDFNDAGAHSYGGADGDPAPGLGMTAVEEQFRRMAFNVIARNQDDTSRTSRS